MTPKQHPEKALLPQRQSLCNRNSAQEKIKTHGVDGGGDVVDVEGVQSQESKCLVSSIVPLLTVSKKDGFCEPPVYSKPNHYKIPIQQNKQSFAEKGPTPECNMTVRKQMYDGSISSSVLVR